jgi:hypothetical protein
LEPRLRLRYEKLVAAHCNGLPELAAGMKALPDTAKSFSHTQALWRFLANERVGLAQLGAPLIAAAREGIAEHCQDYALVAHDWSRLNYNTHQSKSDRLRMTHATDVGYELQSSLMIGDQDGQPLSPVAQNLATATCLLSTYRTDKPGARPAQKLTHLDELSERLRWLDAQKLGKPLVHIIDREADSVDHMRQWSAAGHHWLIRAKGGSRVRSGQESLKLEALAQRLTYQRVRGVEHKGKPCQQWVAETTVVLARVAKPARKNADGTRQKPKPGEAISARLIVSRIEDKAGQVLAVWYLLCQIPDSAQAAQIALWYYFRWRIESFYKLLKQGAQQAESWEQESGLAIFKRLLIASQACVLTWRVMYAKGALAEQTQHFLVRLSGRQTKRTKPVTAPAVLAGLYLLFATLELLQHYSIDELKAYAVQAFPEKFNTAYQDV